MAISIWHWYHHAMSYSAFSGIFVDIMPLCNHGLYILIKFLKLIGGNAVLRDKMSFFHLNIEFCSNLFRDETFTSYSIFVSTKELSFLIHMLTTFYHIFWQNESRAMFVRIGYVFQSTTVSASHRVRNGCSHVRNSSTVHKQENVMWTQVEKDINMGVFILRTFDLTVWRIQEQMKNHV